MSSEFNLSSLTKKAALIAGTSLLNVAWQSKSPSFAAKIAAHIGFEKKWVQAVRWAAIIAREEKQGRFPAGTFWRQLGPQPHEEIDLPSSNLCCFSFEIFSKAANRWDSLNSAERDRLFLELINALRPFEIRVRIVVNKKDREPESVVRFGERKEK